MRLRMTERREMDMDCLLEATGENTKSKAIDTAVNNYLKMRGDNSACPQGAVEELMELAVDEGSVTPDEIAEVLDSEELRVGYEHEWSVGGE